MSVGLYTKRNVTGLKELANQIKYLKMMSSLKDDIQFQKYLQDNCFEVVNMFSNALLQGGEMKDIYITNNKIIKYSGGFIIYNDTTVPTESPGYGGEFSIALAFEYGTGIVGENNPVEGAWAYNVNKHTGPWLYYANGSYHITSGFRGYEIYRNARIYIENNIQKWVFDYCKKKEIEVLSND